MSVWFYTSDDIKFEDLFDGRLGARGVKEHVTDQTTEEERCLTDGDNNYLWVSRHAHYGHALFEHDSSSGWPVRILLAIEEAFSTHICFYDERMGYEEAD